MQNFLEQKLRNIVKGNESMKKAYNDLISALPKYVLIPKITKLLFLDKPIKDHSLLQDEVQKVSLKPILDTSKYAKSDNSLTEEFVTQYFQYKSL